MPAPPPTAAVPPDIRRTSGEDWEPPDVEHRELAGLVEREGVSGEGGDAQPGEDGLLDGFACASVLIKRAFLDCRVAALLAMTNRSASLTFFTRVPDPQQIDGGLL